MTRPDSAPALRARLQVGVRVAMGILAVLAAASCSGPPVPPPPTFTPLVEPDAQRVDAVVYLIGDAGRAVVGHSPVVSHLAEEVERWSRALATDSAVSTVFLGDNVYPVGIRPRDDPDFPVDSARLWSQVSILAGEAARRHRSVGYFLAGNHDWGSLAGPPGRDRLRNQARLLDEFRHETGAVVSLVPVPGDPGPRVVDLGREARLAFIDTHWWLQNRDTVRARELLQGMERALATAGEKPVIMAAHHPFVSGGAHAGPVPIWKGLGILALLRRSGSLIQDLNSVPYRSLVEGMRGVFDRTGPPLVFAGGHDHSLQVIEGSGDDEPRWSLVSGSGSKLTGVRETDGMRLGAEQPGYMRLTFLDDDSVVLHVFATDGPQLCVEGTQEEIDACMERGLEGFQPIFSHRLR